MYRALPLEALTKCVFISCYRSNFEFIINFRYFLFGFIYGYKINRVEKKIFILCAFNLKILDKDFLFYF